MNTVLPFDEFAHPTQFFPAHLNETEGSAAFVDLDGELVRGHGLFMAHESTAEVFTLAESLLDFFRWHGTGGQIVVLEGQLRLKTFDHVHKGRKGFAI
jgi:ribulose-5-phosphate 4-epimerase/fuculose-1-phosphate aldolase